MKKYFNRKDFVLDGYKFIHWENMQEGMEYITNIRLKRIIRGRVCYDSYYLVKI